MSKSLVTTIVVALIAGAAGSGITMLAREWSEEQEEGAREEIEGTVGTTANPASTTATISDDSARVIALAQVPGGKITEGGIETENGKLLYSFDIAVPGRTGVEEIQVDANTGAVLAHEHESPEAEAAEKS